jgi:hypothetical protein
VFKAGVLDGLKPQVTKKEAAVQSQAPVDAFNLRPAFALKLYDLTRRRLRKADWTVAKI